MEKVLVSVILPTYNRAELLQRCVDSVLTQTYTDMQVIIVNDGSTDSTRELLDKITDPRVEVYHLQENNHINYALNYGIEKASGKYIARIDSDDTWKSDKIQKQVEFMEVNQKYGACFTWVDVVDEAGSNINETMNHIYHLFRQDNRSQKEWAKFFLNHGNCLSHPSVLIRKSILDEIGAYHLAIAPAQDYELWVRLIMKTPIYVMPECLVNYCWVDAREGKISSLAEQGVIKFFNILMLVREHFFDYMSDQQFVEWFSDEFKYAGSHTKIELECEKAFLLCKCVSSVENQPVLGVRRLAKLLENKEAVKVLKEKFDFKPKDFYKLNSQQMYKDPAIVEKLDILQRKLNESEEQLRNNEAMVLGLKGEVQQKQEQIADYKHELQKRTIYYTELIQEYENSTSWKITKPLRAIRNLFKK